MFSLHENNFTMWQLTSDHCRHYDFASIIVLYIFMAIFILYTYAIKRIKKKQQRQNDNVKFPR